MKAVLIFGICLFVLLSPSALAVKIEVAHDPEVDFSRYSTYAWIEGSPAAKPEVEIWIVGAIEDELKAKGWRKVAGPEKPDVHLKSVVMSLVNVQLFSNYIASATGGWGFWQANTRAYGDGALIVDIIDPDTDELIWRSIARGTVSGAWYKVEKKAPKIASEMFKGFPPYFVP